MTVKIISYVMGGLIQFCFDKPGKIKQIYAKISWSSFSFDCSIISKCRKNHNNLDDEFVTYHGMNSSLVFANTSNEGFLKED